MRSEETGKVHKLRILAVRELVRNQLVSQCVKEQLGIEQGRRWLVGEALPEASSGRRKKP